MIGKQLFVDRTIETEARAVVNEVIDHIRDQNQSGTLSPEFYDSTLLLIAELLPYVKEKAVWTEWGHQICWAMKESMEAYGYRRQTTVFGGLMSKCFAVHAFCQEAKILGNFARSMDRVLFLSVHETLEQIEGTAVCDSQYDLISGLSGALYYLLDCVHTQEEKEILIKCLSFLVDLTRDTEFDGKPMIRFHVLQPDQNPYFDQEIFKNGSINFGLAHGMLGPLIAMAKAYSMGFSVDGLPEGIEKVYRMYEVFQLENEEKVPLWPGVMTVEEYWAGRCQPEQLHISSSWCYGNAGVIRGLQKVATYMHWKEREGSAIEAMKRLFAQNIQAYNLFSPSLCHGFSSLVAIQTCAYAAYQDPGLLIHLERHVRQLIDEYRKSNERKVDLMDIRNRVLWVEGYLEDLSLLTGSAGVAVALLSLNGPVQTGRLLLID